MTWKQGEEMDGDSSSWLGHSYLDSEGMDPAVDDSLNFSSLEGTEFISSLNGGEAFDSLDDPAYMTSSFDEEGCCAPDEGFAELQGNSSAQPDDQASCNAFPDSFGPDSMGPDSSAMEYTGEESFLPDFNQFQKPSLSLGQVNLYADGGLTDMFLQGNRVMNHLSPTSPGKVSLPSPGSVTAEKLKNMTLGPHPYNYDDKVGATHSGSRPAAGTLSKSPGSKRFPTASLTSPTAGNSHLPYSGQNLSAPGMLGSPPKFDSKDNVLLGPENLRQPLQGHSMYMPPPGGLQPRTTDGGGSSGYVQEVDVNVIGDGLRPLQNMPPRGNSMYMPPPGGLQPRTTDGGASSGYVQEVDARGDGLRPRQNMAPRGNSMYMPPPGGLQPRTNEGGGSSGFVQEGDARGDSLRPLQNMAPRNNSMYMPPPGGLQPRTTEGGGSSGYVQEMDASGDGLRPLQSMAPPRPSSLMQRSLSSHALGQFRTLASGPQGNGHMSPTELSRIRDFGVSGSRPQQSQASDMHGLNGRPMMGSMRRVHSTGDIQSLQGASGPSDGALKPGRITAEEKIMKIKRYKQKRAERNYNKKIKYACRKTLADSRPRVRGRFAKNEDTELPAKQSDEKHEEDDEEADMVLEEDDDLFADEDSSGDFPVVTGLKSIDLKTREDSLSMFSAG